MTPASGQGSGKVHIYPPGRFVVAGDTRVVLMDMNLINDGTFHAGQGSVHFTGTRNDTLTANSATSFYNLIVDKASAEVHFYIPPELPCTIANLLALQGAGSRLILHDGSIAIGANAAIQGADNQRFIVTVGQGRLFKFGLTNFTFPIGPERNRYNPIKVQTQQPENIGVRCLPQVRSGGITGNPLTQGVVNASWVISRDPISAATINLTAQWNASDELPGFNGADCGIARYLGNGDWDLAGADIGQKSGPNPYFVARNGIAGDGVFAVGSQPLMYPLRVAMHTWLQGAFNPATGLMNDNLRSAQLIPLKEPYAQMPGFVHAGRGGGETVSSTVLGVSGPQAIVDWVFAELRSGTASGTVLETRSALIRRDGNVVDVDGVSPVTFRGRPAGAYYVALRHRNHLGVRTPTTLMLSNEPASTYDFASAQFNAYQGVQAFLGPGLGWGMYGGNANSNTNVRYTGALNDHSTLLDNCLGGNKALVLSNVYSTCDLNMNGVVRYTGPLNDQNFLLNTVLGGDKTKVITQPNF